MARCRGLAARGRIEVRIHAPDHEGDGEIVVRGPNIFLGYWRQPERTADVLHDGWFHTGDLGRVLSDGRVKITGRLKNMIATAAGKKIYPEEIEVQLSNSPYVLEVVVAGGTDARGEREEVHAHIYPNMPAIEALAREKGVPCDDAFVENVLKHEVELHGDVLAPYKRVARHRAQVRVREDHHRQDPPPPSLLAAGVSRLVAGPGRTPRRRDPPLSAAASPLSGGATVAIRSVRHHPTPSADQFEPVAHGESGRG
jgi:acyl-CoA synthetase (AMP-forming)/AMP-acid ligase II